MCHWDDSDSCRLIDYVTDDLCACIRFSPRPREDRVVVVACCSLTTTGQREPSVNGSRDPAWLDCDRL